MRAKSVILILVALGCGLLASIGVSQVMDQGGGESQTVQILVASADIDYGDELTEENTRVEDWPSHKLPLGALKGLDEVEHPVASRLVAGVPITATMIKPVAGPATTIPVGYRVVTSRVKLDEAAGNLLKPGDRVDLIAFFRKSHEIPKTATRKILRNVRVFAVNTETERIDGGQTVAKTVGFLVKEEQVERTMLAIRLGEMSVALRRPDEPEHGEAGVQPSFATIESVLGTGPESADDTPAPRPYAAQATPVPSDEEQHVAVFSPSGQMIVFGPDNGTLFQFEPNKPFPSATPLDTGAGLPSPVPPAPASGFAPIVPVPVPAPAHES